MIPMGQPQLFASLFMFFTASLVLRDQKYSQIENVILPALRSLIDLWASYFVELEVYNKWFLTARNVPGFSSP